MRITRETLLKASQDVVTQRIRMDRGIIAVYLVGSLLSDNPLLGGATDIDLVFIHDSDPPQEREIGRLSSDITLDIAHHRQADYKHPRNLRVQPWLGPSVFSTRVVLHDTQHWFEFTQASVTSQFNRPENVISRARPQAESARQLWLEIEPNTNNHLKNLLSYLKAIKTGANAIASLSGAPLTDRRFMLNFPERSQAIGKPGLASGLLGLMGADHASADQIRAWLPFWQGAMQALEGLDQIPVSLHPYRRSYYERAFGAILSGDQPVTVLWSMLWTWTQAINSLPAGSPHISAWQEACFNLKLGPEQFDEKYSALDAFLDNIEETLEVWSKQNGV
jgi:predicted nucleotidyltransferase